MKLPKGPCKKIQKNPKIQKDFGSGWVGQVSNWKFKKIGKYIFIHYFITFLGDHSNVNNVINALLCLLDHGPGKNLVPPRGTKAHMVFLIGLCM